MFFVWGLCGVTLSGDVSWRKFLFKCRSLMRTRRNALHSRRVGETRAPHWPVLKTILGQPITARHCPATQTGLVKARLTFPPSFIFTRALARVKKTRRLSKKAALQICSHCQVQKQRNISHNSFLRKNSQIKIFET